MEKNWDPIWSGLAQTLRGLEGSVSSVFSARCHFSASSWARESFKKAVVGLAVGFAGLYGKVSKSLTFLWVSVSKTPYGRRRRTSGLSSWRARRSGSPSPRTSRWTALCARTSVRAPNTNRLCRHNLTVRAVFEFWYCYISGLKPFQSFLFQSVGVAFSVPEHPPPPQEGGPRRTQPPPLDGGVDLTPPPWSLSPTSLPSPAIF